MFHPNQFRTEPIVTIESGRIWRLPRRRLRLQGRAHRLAPASSLLRRAGAADRPDRRSRHRR